MSLLTGIEAQPNFPREDLTDTNAAMLELLLSNTDVVRNSHSLSESGSWIFQVGHRMVLKTASNVLERDARIEAIDHGATIYEAVSGMVTALPTRTKALFSIEIQVAAWTNANLTQAIEYQQEALAKFHGDMSRTQEVVTATTQRLYPHLTGYAVLGAAISRQFELDCTED